MKPNERISFYNYGVWTNFWLHRLIPWGTCYFPPVHMYRVILSIKASKKSPIILSLLGINLRPRDPIFAPILMSQTGDQRQSSSEIEVEGTY